ncbi:MAG TPA: hypothetical protein VGM43_13045 [Bryobacteraceae bacterium]
MAFLTICACAPAFAQTYAISTFAGGGAPINIPATSAPLADTFAVAVDNQGNLFFVNDNNVLRRDAASGVLSLVAGNGTPGFSGDNGPAENAQLLNPFGVAVDSAGNVFIADSGNNRIRKVSGGIITTVAGNGLAYFGGDNGPATSGELNAPSGIAVDSAGNLYIADRYNRRVRKVSNGIITTVAGNGQQGYSGDNGPATSAQLTPIAVAVDSAGSLFIAANENIREVSVGIITTVAGNGSQGFAGDNGPATAAQLNSPQGVALDAAGNIYIADTQNSEIRKVSAGVITTLAGNRTAGFSGDGGPAASASLNYPWGVAASPDGTVYVADYRNSRIRQVSNGAITTVAGNGQYSLFGGDGGPATDAQASPLSVTFDQSGDLYITDRQRIRKVHNGVITTVAGNGVAGFAGDGGPATSAELNNPEGVAVDSAGNLYIADTSGNRIRMVSNGVISTVAGGAGLSPNNGDGGPATSAYLSSPSSVAIDSAGDLLIADFDHNEIRKVSGGVISTFAGTGLAGVSGDNIPANTARLTGVASLTVAPSGDVYFADIGSNRIRKISNGIITTVAGNGTAGFSGDNGSAVNASLNEPCAVAVDSAGNLYIIDRGNIRIRKVDTAGVITTIAGQGTNGFSGDGGPALDAEFYDPLGIAADKSGNIYVADQGNQRVRVLIPGGVPPPANRPVIAAVVSAVDYSPSVAPGSWIAIFGGNLSPETVALTTLPLQNQLSGVTVTMSGTPLALRYVSSTQVNALLPFGPPGTYQFVVSTAAGSSLPFQLTLDTFAPALYTRNASGTGPAFAFDAGFQVVPVLGTDPVVIYASGLGPVDPPADASAGGNAVEPFNRVTNPVSVKIGGQPATVLFAGLAPNLPGVYQLNVAPPAGTLPDNSLVVSSSSVASVPTTLPVPLPANVANVSGGITLLYPVNGSNLDFSALLTAARFNTTFDILPGAKPFNVIAGCTTGSANISFSPDLGTWQAALTVPAQQPRTGDFSLVRNSNGSLIVVLDFLNSNQQFPDNRIPQSRLDPIATQALTAIPNPGASTGAPNVTYSTQGTIPANGHVVIDSSTLANLTQFGAFSFISPRSVTQPVRRAACSLTVDGKVTATSLSAFN